MHNCKDILSFDTETKVITFFNYFSIYTKQRDFKEFCDFYVQNYF